MEKVIDITAKRDGFRRAGLVHSEITVTYPLSDFTKEQLEQLQNETMLVVAIRNADESVKSGGDQVEELKKKIQALEGDLQILVTQEADAQKQLIDLTAALDDERKKNDSAVASINLGKDALEEANGFLTVERQKVSELTTDLEGERHKVTDLTAQLEAATKKRK